MIHILRQHKKNQTVKLRPFVSSCLGLSLRFPIGISNKADPRFSIFKSSSGEIASASSIGEDISVRGWAREPMIPERAFQGHASAWVETEAGRGWMLILWEIRKWRQKKARSKPNKTKVTRCMENQALPREEVGGGALSSSPEVKVQRETMQRNPERRCMLQLITLRTSKVPCAFGRTRGPERSLRHSLVWPKSGSSWVV